MYYITLSFSRLYTISKPLWSPLVEPTKVINPIYPLLTANQKSPEFELCFYFGFGCADGKDRALQCKCPVVGI